jgi:lactoylglutathione lyase
MTKSFESAPGVAPTLDEATQNYVFNHSMLRIKNPERSLDFYTRVLGMRLVRKLDFPEMKFTLYFLAHLNDEEAGKVPAEAEKRTTWMFQQRAVLELTHNWGTENDPEVQYHDGNAAPQGFGHIAFSVPDVYRACERLETLGVPFVKKPDAGKMKGLAFVKDPDGYWVEILQADMIERQATLR